MADQSINFAPRETQIAIRELTSVNLAMICVKCNLSAVSAHMLVLSHLVDGLSMVDPKVTTKLLHAMAKAFSPTSTENERDKAARDFIAMVNHFHSLADLYEAKTEGSA